MIANDLKQFSPFADLSTDELELVLPLLEERALAKGRRVFSEGDDGDGLVLLCNGSVVISTAAGHEGAADAPAAFGAVALVSTGNRAMTVVAAEPCILYILSRTAFHRLAEDAPRAAVRMLEAIVSELGGLLRQSMDHV